MNRRHVASRFVLVAALGFFLAAYASGQDRVPAAAATERPVPGSVVKSIALDASVEERILALDPEHISDLDVRSTLAAGPTPRIMLFHGGVYPVHLLMESFSRFLTGMGYPEERIRDAGDGSLSRSPYEPGDRQAGLIAWYYEREGVRPILVGHSQGGIQVVKILHELAGSFGVHGEQLTKPAELEPAMRRAFSSGKAAVLDVICPIEGL